MQENKKNVSLVILESPAKAATVNSYLGSGYKVIACKGHVRDLPKSTLGVDTICHKCILQINPQILL